MSSILKAAAAALALGSATVSGSGVPARTLGALGQDDACAAGSGGDDGACAMQALQQRSAKGVLPEGPSTDAGTTAAAAADAPATVEAPSDPWIWPEEIIKKQYVFSGGNYTESKVNSYAQPLTQIVSYFCERWMSYNWVKVAFWSQQLLRRAAAMPENPTQEHTDRFRKFGRQASFLTCVWNFDPQLGSNFSKPVADYMTQVAHQPDTELEMPQLGEWFTQQPQATQLYSIDGCMFWVTSNFCDMGYLSRDLKGEKDYGDGICWDKVQGRNYNITFMDQTIDLGFNLNIIAQDDDFDHSEFEQCQDHPFTRDVVKDSCPMFGHYPKNMWGLDDFNWGDVPEKGSPRYNEVLSCEAHLGVPETTKMNFYDSLPYPDTVGLMDTPGWRIQQLEAQKEARDQTFEIAKGRYASAVSGVGNVLNTTDWQGIYNNTVEAFASPESQAAWQAAAIAAAGGAVTGNYTDATLAAAKAMGTVNYTKAAKAMWGTGSAAARAYGNVVSNEFGAVGDILGHLAESMNKSIWETDYDNTTMYHRPEVEASLAPQDGDKPAEDQPAAQPAAAPVAEPSAEEAASSQ